MSYKRREQNKNSMKVLIGINILVGLIILSRLYQLQIVEYDTYGPLSKENSIREESVHPARGLILDKNGDLLADNEPIYTVTITPASFEKENLVLLSNLIGENEEDLTQRVNKAQKYSWQRSSRLIPEVNFESFSKLQEHIWELPGIGHQIESRRNYPTSVNASHILGYLREITEGQYEKLEGYRLGDQFGTTGLERVYESTLRGQLGTSYIRINAYGQSLGSYENGELDINPTSGKNLHTSIDAKMQVLAEDLMENKVGAVVAIDPRNGAIRTLVSAPDYDLTRLSGKLDQKYWAEINADTAKPLFNRAVSAMQPPGSTFKPLMALVGLKLGLIDKDTEVICRGSYIKGREYKCTAFHGKQTVESAIQNSCNTFFFSLMNKIGTQVGLDTWNEYVTSFPVGSRTGIDLPNESRGIIPDTSYFDRVFGKNKWGIGDVINLGVGQGALGVTPLQAATMASVIANGGYLIKPHIVEGISVGNGPIDSIKYARTKIDWIDEEQLALVRNGMRRVVTDGSARWYANIKEVEISGKTGTAQNPHGFDHAWFICYAPSDNPEIAMAVMVENAGFGATSALPIATLLMEQYFGGEVRRQWVYDRMKNFVPKAAEVRR